MKRIVTVACLVAGTLLADTTPVMVSLVTPVQAPWRSYDVTGLRLSLIYGECQDFTGLDIGVVDITRQDFTGLDIGVVDITRKDFTGLAVGGINCVCDRLYGAQVGLVNWNGNGETAWERRSVGAQVGILNYADTFCGLQDGIVNISGTSFMGLQSSLVNCAHDMYGLQCGCYFILAVNAVGGTLRGCQIGLVNYANRVERGCQIGFVNIISHNGWLPVLPIINGSF